MSVAQDLGGILVEENSHAHAGRPGMRLAPVILFTDDELAALIEPDMVMGVGAEEDDMLEDAGQAGGRAWRDERAMFRAHDDRYLAAHPEIARNMSRNHSARLKLHLGHPVNSFDHLRLQEIGLADKVGDEAILG